MTDDERIAEMHELERKIEYLLKVLPKYVARLEQLVKELSQANNLENVASD